MRLAAMMLLLVVEFSSPAFAEVWCSTKEVPTRDGPASKGDCVSARSQSELVAKAARYPDWQAVLPPVVGPRRSDAMDGRPVLRIHCEAGGKYFAKMTGNTTDDLSCGWDTPGEAQRQAVQSCLKQVGCVDTQFGAPWGWVRVFQDDGAEFPEAISENKVYADGRIE